MEKVNVINVNEAIEKQMPQKPINVKKSDGEISAADCPGCGYSFPDIGGAMEYYGVIEQYSYCPECGQKLEW